MAILSAALRLARRKQGNPITVDEMTLDRQCEPEFITWLEESFDKNNYEAVISLAWSIGPQYIAETFKDLPVYPGLNTGFMGGTTKSWYLSEEYCAPAEIAAFIISGIVSGHPLRQKSFQWSLRRIGRRKVRS